METFHIKNFIAHSAEKEQHHREVALRLRDSVYTVDGVSFNFVDTLTKKFDAQSKQIGEFFTTSDSAEHFDEDGDRPATGSGVSESSFQDLLKTHYNNDSDQFTDFITFTQQAMQVFSNHIEKSAPAVGGFLLFYHYRIEQRGCLMVIMLDKGKGFNFNQSLDVIEVDILDYNKLKMACQIDLAGWSESHHDHCVKFIARSSSQGAADYFTDFIGCKSIKESKAHTRSLYHSLNSYFNHHQIGEEDKGDIRERIAIYCETCDEDKRGLIDVDDLSLTLDCASNITDENAKGKFIELCNEYAVPGQFHVHMGTVSKHRTLQAKNTYMSISVRMESIGRLQSEGGKPVQVAPEGYIVIKKPPEQLIAKIREHFPGLLNQNKE